jgi:hypothetical protein
MTDLRAERRAIAAQFNLAGADVAESYRRADEHIQHDLDNPPEWEAVKDSLTTEGWTHHTERLPTEADAPAGYIHVGKVGDTITMTLDQYLNHTNREYCPYWHHATGQHQIPKAPEVKSENSR